MELGGACRKCGTGFALLIRFHLSFCENSRRGFYSDVSDANFLYIRLYGASLLYCGSVQKVNSETEIPCWLFILEEKWKFHK